MPSPAAEAAAPALDQLPPTRRDLLLILKKRGEARAQDLADALGITASAVRQHLTELAEAGLVAHRALRDGRGRPKHAWSLSARGEGLFPRSYDELATEVLDSIAAEDPALVERVFERRRRRRVEGARARLAGRPFPERVAELARILDEDGYLAAFDALPDGTFRVTEHNCAVFAVARHYGGLCASEISFLREALPDADIERVAHMLSGAHTCAYLVRERASPPGA